MSSIEESNATFDTEDPFLFLKKTSSILGRSQMQLYNVRELGLTKGEVHKQRNYEVRFKNCRKTDDEKQNNIKIYISMARRFSLNGCSPIVVLNQTNVLEIVKLVRYVILKWNRYVQLSKLS